MKKGISCRLRLILPALALFFALYWAGDALCEQYLSLYLAQRGLTASRAGMFSVLNPLAAMLWGYLVLGERITPVKALGAALIVAGLLLPAAADAKVEDGR